MHSPEGEPTGLLGAMRVAILIDIVILSLLWHEALPLWTKAIAPLL